MINVYVFTLGSDFQITDAINLVLLRQTKKPLTTYIRTTYIQHDKKPSYTPCKLSLIFVKLPFNIDNHVQY